MQDLNNPIPKINTPEALVSFDGRDSGRQFRSFLARTEPDIDISESSANNLITDLMGQWIQQTAFIAQFTIAESSPQGASQWLALASILSAKGFTPSQVTASRIKGTLTSEVGTFINKFNSVFSVKFGSDAKTLPYVLSDHITSGNNRDVELIQGTWESFTYLINGDGNTSFEIPIDGKYIDLASVDVRIYESRNSDSYRKTSLLTDISDLETTSYLFKLGNDGRYSISFSCGAVTRGNQILINWVRTDSPTPLTPPNASDINSTLGVFKLASYHTGAGRPNIDDLRLSYATHYNNKPFQRYKNLVLKKFSQVGDVHIVSGNTLIPPQYGITYVYLSLNGDNLLDAVLAEDIQHEMSLYESVPTLFLPTQSKVIGIEVEVSIDRRRKNDEVDKILGAFNTDELGRINSGFYPSILIQKLTEGLTPLQIKVLDVNFVYTLLLSQVAGDVVPLPETLDITKVSLDNKESLEVKGQSGARAVNVTPKQRQLFKTIRIETGDLLNLRIDSVWVPKITKVSQKLLVVE